MSARLMTLTCLGLHARVTVKLLHRWLLLRGGLGPLTVKAAERALANLARDGLVRAYQGIGKEKAYTLTPKGAARLGLDRRRFRRQPRFGAVKASLALLMFCVHENRLLLTEAEFAAEFPELAACGFDHRRYFFDDDREQPLLSMVVPDYATDSVRRVARRCVREVQRRKAGGPWQDFVYARLFQVVVVTPTAGKAAEIAARLKHETFPHRVVTVPELASLVFLDKPG